MILRAAAGSDVGRRRAANEDHYALGDVKDRVLEFLELLQPGSHEPTAARDPFNVDRRIEMRSSQVALALPIWAGGYERTVPAALALLAALEAHDVVPAAVSRQIRMLAAMATRP